VNPPRDLFAVSFLSLALGGSASAKEPSCRIEPFQGATLPQGTVARMHLVNGGDACAITAFGDPTQKANPADSGKITRQPAHGAAEFAAPQAQYTPARGYVGNDEFEFEAFARGRGGQRLRLKVQVKVSVTGP